MLERTLLSSVTDNLCGVLRAIATLTRVLFRLRLFITWTSHVCMQLYWTEESAQNVSIGLLPPPLYLRGVSVYLSLSTDR
jgi:hypothetical protein